MNNKVIIIYNHDISKYPPILQAIESIHSQGKKVEIIGFFGNKAYKESLKKKGIIIHEIKENNTQANAIKKFNYLISYKKNVYSIVKKIADKDTLILVNGNENAWLLHKLFDNYKCILYLFEIPEFKVSFRYRILSPQINYKKIMHKAHKIVCCEYNRAKITQSFFGLRECPAIIPNKIELNIDVNKTPENAANATSLIPKDKKIILYQGIFNQPERRLDELCQAINYLPEDYIICIMGGECKEKRLLKEKYESSRVLFLPYLPAPDHLYITRLAHIGFLSYFSVENNIGNALNTLYCAPNKIFEYSKFGIPMISNDVPALKSDFEKFQSGIVVSNFAPEYIAQAILSIESNYMIYTDGAKAHFLSTQISELYSNLIDTITN